MLHGEDAGSADTRGETRGKGGGDDDDPESSESDSSSEESKDATPGSSNIKKATTHTQNDDGDVSSVTTRQNKTERNHYILRMAIDEKFIPGSI